MGRKHQKITLEDEYTVLTTAIIAQAFSDLCKNLSDLYIIDHSKENDFIAHKYGDIYRKMSSEISRLYRNAHGRNIKKEHLKQLCDNRMSFKRDALVSEISDIKRFFRSDQFDLYSNLQNGEWYIESANRIVKMYISGKILKLPSAHFDGMYSKG